MSFFDRHQDLIEKAVQSAKVRGYWSAFSEMPSPKVYGESAPADGKAAFESYQGQKFELNQPGQGQWLSPEVSPYGVKLGVSYPKCDPQALLDAAKAAMPAWQALGARERVGLCVQAITELNARSFEIAHAVMATTGQGWMMAFQAGARTHKTARWKRWLMPGKNKAEFRPKRSGKSRRARTRRSACASNLRSWGGAWRW